MRINVKNTTFFNPLDLIAPHSCRGCGRIGNLLCERCKNNILAKHQNRCPNCKSPAPTGDCPNCKNLPPIFTIDERNSLVGQLIYDLKFSSSRAAALHLAEILNQTLPKFKGKVIIAPLPTTRQHIRKRGLDHTHLIAKKLAHLRGKNYSVSPILIRHTNSTQVGTNAQTRIKQAASAYEIHPNIVIDQNVTYLLLDDIWTTGASMNAAIKKLREAGVCKIKAIVLAVSRLD